MTTKLSFGWLLGWLAAVVAAATVAASIWLHPPSEMRARRMDEVRMQSLNQTKMAIRFYYTAHHMLPPGLNALEAEENHHQDVRWHDPETGQPFEYATTGETAYRLCATFARHSDQSDNLTGLNGTHNSGRDCFQEKVTTYGQ
jgi:hypothetical protein